ncbi:ROK family protein [Kutzneria viridogrisea]|uniref:HTH marR-type domain-containing protein n=2 Tax=Kutzneria TaxID=43356 RepID=W5WM13_9PSEU|nr:ROK family transcriptional regulator [Kutzneria albida]AHI01821.1 hypothetical protein KALB_8464 [Kutzneria albida DSM 43870]MBA8929761.1 putative NBD/HSP70 family sugar kinase [Kutzneria viridogrisea]MBA8931787.1 putative NBD/HSP70 family sugar kinase [Kutzneria viridogrisea]
MASEELTSAGQVLRLVAEGTARSRADLARELGVAASTVSLRVQELLDAGLVAESGEGESSGGRRPRLLRLCSNGAVVVGVDLGSHHARLGVLDLGGALLEVREDPLDLALGPARTIGRLAEAIREVAGDRPVRAVGIGVPGPVDVPLGRVVAPARMPGWHGARVRELLAAELDVPVFADNDANLMALGEHARAHRDLDHLVLVKLGRGIGCGVVVNGGLHRGAAGCAGDITHTRVPEAGERPCSCGNTGCLETVASGAALLGQLGAEDLDQVVRLVADGDPHATTLVRTAGRHIGGVLAVVVNFTNPQAVVLAGALARAEPLVAAVRSVLYERCLPVASRNLLITSAVTGADAGVLGAGLAALDAHVYR